MLPEMRLIGRRAGGGDATVVPGVPVGAGDDRRRVQVEVERFAREDHAPLACTMFVARVPLAQLAKVARSLERHRRIARHHAVARKGQVLVAEPLRRFLVRFESVMHFEDRGEIPRIAHLSAHVRHLIPFFQSRREVRAPAERGDRRPLRLEVRLAPAGTVDEGRQPETFDGARSGRRGTERPVCRQKKAAHRRPLITR